MTREAECGYGQMGSTALGMQTLDFRTVPPAAESSSPRQLGNPRCIHSVPPSTVYKSCLMRELPLPSVSLSSQRPTVAHTHASAGVMSPPDSTEDAIYPMRVVHARRTRVNPHDATPTRFPSSSTLETVFSGKELPPAPPCVEATLHPGADAYTRPLFSST